MTSSDDTVHDSHHPSAFRMLLSASQAIFLIPNELQPIEAASAVLPFARVAHHCSDVRNPFDGFTHVPMTVPIHVYLRSEFLDDCAWNYDIHTRIHILF